MTVPCLAQAATGYVCGGTCGAGWGVGDDGNPGTSKSAPFKTISAGISKMSGGSMLVVGDGTYAEAITGMPNGTASAFTSIVAENDWGVLIDGAHFPDTFISGITVNGKSYVKVQGFRVKMSQTTGNNVPVQVVGSHHIKIIRCSGSYGPVDGNAAAFDIGPDSDYVLIEECYAYGGTRYMFLAYWSDHTVFRRNVARNDYWAGSLQSAGFVTYDSVNTVFQNNIALDSSADNTAGGYYGGFWAENKEDRAEDTSQTHDGNIVLNIKTSTYAAGISHEKLSGTVKVRNLILWDSDSGYWGDQGVGVTANLLMQNLTMGNTSGNYDENNGQAADGTGVGITSALANTVRSSLFYRNHSFGIAGYVNSDYNAFFQNGANAGGKHVPTLGAHDVTNIDPATGGLLYLPRIENGSALKAAGEAGGQIGAQVINRIGVAGTLYGETGWDAMTTEPLWPFPNEAQIKADMAAYAGRGGAGARGFCTGTAKDGSPQTLTKYIWEYLGNPIPAEIYGCTTVSACLAKDGCCPVGCTFSDDSDCPAPPEDAGTAQIPGDAGALDTATSGDTGASKAAKGGCSCSTASGFSPGAGTVLLLGLLLIRGRSTRSRRSWRATALILAMLILPLACGGKDSRIPGANSNPDGAAGDFGDAPSATQNDGARPDSPGAGGANGGSTSTGGTTSTGGLTGTGGTTGIGGTKGGGTTGTGGTVSDPPISIPSQAWTRDVAASGYTDGVPMGGLGAGYVTWSFDGSFRHGLNIGQSAPVSNSAFFMYQKPSSQAASVLRLDTSGLKEGQATYHALLPRAWVEYTGNQFPCKAVVEQSSPIIPGDYRRTSYPVGTFRWQISNPTAEPCDVAIMLTWRNELGGASVEPVSSADLVGIKLKRAGTGDAALETDAEFTLATAPSAKLTVSYQSDATLATLKTSFEDDGVLANTTGAHPLGALAIKASIAPGETASFPIVLAWDIPIAEANGTSSTRAGNKWYREYTRHFGRTGLRSADIAREALIDGPNWRAAISTWHRSVLENPAYPDWLKQMLFNELYYYQVGGTYWEAGAASGQKDNPDEDMFTSLECRIYDYYGTSDVRFYGSWALALLWPEIDKQEVKQFCDSVTTTRTDRPAPLGTTAHDLGNSYDVFTRLNDYNYRDSTVWKDLNSKLVLMVYRDWALGGKSDSAFLQYCWPAVKVAMAKVKEQDSDADGLPNSSGIDQTYDNMSLMGNTAYCGSLLLAALEAADEMGRAMGDTTVAQSYATWLTKAKASFESKLWNGKYYNIDTAGTRSDRIMADQLAGEWYAKACGLPSVVPEEHARSAFQTVYENNFKKFDSGAHGVVNLMTASGQTDSSSIQSVEVWVGTSFAVAAGLIQEGLASAGTEIGASLHATIWKEAGLWFRTPEAWTSGVNDVRAPYYMRANAIWAVKRALDLAQTP